MARQNRVTPFGEIIATSARGTLMGNRGCLHDEAGNLGSRRWSRLAWVSCLLDYKGRKRQLMAPGQYTELFFLDETTALAAGHRPCAKCRCSDYNAFKTLWLQANGHLLKGTPPTIANIDKLIHQERVTSRGKARLSDLPDGTFITEDDRSAFLIWEGNLLRWFSEGYHEALQRLDNIEVRVLTPASVVRVLAGGYVPAVSLPTL